MNSCYREGALYVFTDICGQAFLVKDPFDPTDDPKK